MPLCIYNRSNCLRRLKTTYFAGKFEVSLVMVIFGNPDMYAIGYVHTSIHVFGRMERTLYFEKGNCIV